jgi:hypothetical protein
VAVNALCPGFADTAINDPALTVAAMLRRDCAAPSAVVRSG